VIGHLPLGVGVGMLDMALAEESTIADLVTIFCLMRGSALVRGTALD
jgi:hypothetical protein